MLFNRCVVVPTSLTTKPGIFSVLKIATRHTHTKLPAYKSTISLIKPLLSCVTKPNGINYKLMTFEECEFNSCNKIANIHMRLQNARSEQR